MLNFTKMHALGNDFMVVNKLTQNVSISKLPIVKLANRYLGVGFDQLLIIDEATTSADYFCHIFNADGSVAQQCGNGLRCVARYLHERNLVPTNELKLQTKAGIYPAYIKDYDHITVSLGAPSVHQQHKLWLFPDNKHYPVTVLALGNLHAIVAMQDIANQSLSSVAEFIHTQLKDCNIGLMEIVNPSQIKLRTYERGVGETLACGSNACAAALTGALNFGLNHKVEILLPHGQLVAEWKQNDSLMSLTGPASKSYDGVLDIGSFIKTS